MKTPEMPAPSASRQEESPKNIRPETSRILYLTPVERVVAGKAARSITPRELNATWNPTKDRPDPIDLLEGQAATRVSELVPIRYGRMLVSPFAFYRGAAVIMASDLATTPDSGLHVQLCGDAHLANFGGFASPERDIVFDINDFDETLPGPWEWDLKRLAASIEVAGRERGFSAKQRRAMVLSSVGEYRRAMGEFARMHNLEVWYALLDASKIQARWGMIGKSKGVKRIEADFSHAYTRDNLRAFEKLTHRVDNQLRIVSNPPLVVPVEELFPASFDLVQFQGIFKNYIATYGKTLVDDRRHILEQFRFVHIARKVVGVGSVGTRTWIILLLGRDEEDPLFLQVKEAQSSVLEAYLGKSRYADHGKRVVKGQRLMQAASDIFLGWERVTEGFDGGSHDFYVRQLWDWKFSVDLQRIPPDEMSVYAEMCGWTLARAHARTGDRIAISAYLGKSNVTDQALAEFAIAYADQNELDYQALLEAVKTGRVKAETGI